MLRTLLITTAISGVLISGAIAQSETAAAPAKDQSAAPKESASTSVTKFIMAQAADQWVFTKFRGLDVRGPDDVSIGSVNDLLFDKTGKIIGVVISVGGFLGIGAKNEAIDMSALDVVLPESGNDTNNTPADANDPSNVKLKVMWTKDQLQDAPDFQYYKPPARSALAPSPTTTGSAPRPAAPASPRPQTQ